MICEKEWYECEILQNTDRLSFYIHTEPKTPGNDRYLHVNVRPIADQQLQTRRPLRGGGSEVQRGEALVVGLADISAAVNQLTDGGVLAVEAGQVQRRVPKGVGVVRLSGGKNETEKRTVVTKMSPLFCLCWVNTASCGTGTCYELWPDLHRQA